MQVLTILKTLKREYPDSTCSLNFKTPYQLMVATILSAQCTDERVNKTTPALFKKFPTSKEMSRAKLKDLEKLVKSTGFYKNKSKSLLENAKSLEKDHGGRVPETLEELIQLRGVGRKTANVILGTAFGKNEGVVVDTHVGRLSRRMGLTKQIDPVKVEKDLVQILPRKDWGLWSHLLIDHGRKYCQARKPNCYGCFLAETCPKVGVSLK